MSGLPAAIAGHAVRGARRAGGGDINDAYVVELDGGGRAFVKVRPSGADGPITVAGSAGIDSIPTEIGSDSDDAAMDIAPTAAVDAEYAAEAAGLRWLAEPAGLLVPEVLDRGPGFLALELVEPGRLSAAGEEELGRGLAQIHAAGAPAHGALPPGAPECGLRLAGLVLPGEPAADWPSFYAQARLWPLALKAEERGALPRAGLDAVERVCERIHELAGPPESPARLHGDLWSGNVLAGADGRPRLIDPAAHGGHREIDLAMLMLFGAPSARTLAAYDELEPRAEGHRERIGLWQLFPLLVHALLFGGGYGARAAQLAARCL